MILVILERGADDTAAELAAAARALEPDGQVVALMAGPGDAPPYFDAVHKFGDERFAEADGDLEARAFAPLIQQLAPRATLIAHTNLGLDLAPVLAGLLDAPFLSDCLSLEANGDGFRAVRPLFGGKLHAKVTCGAGAVLSLRPGAFEGEAPEAGGAVQSESIPDGVDVRRRFVETVAPEAGAVDISQSDVLVAVGRGIEEDENLEMVEALAEALGADLACTRPVVDKGWMEKSRQVGTSGVAVKPRVYLTVGVSGSFQHMGGVKGGPFVAAINKDPAAPIFGVANVGIVGDLFDLVPLLEEKIRERKG
jgi:electron transfer flavoprotein alpha subunit